MLINPISFRLSISIFWNSTWSLYKNYNYKYLFYSDLVFFEFFMFFFKKTSSFRYLDFYPSHLRLYRLNNKIVVNLYYHIAKEAYYFDEINGIYKKLLKSTSIKKKVYFRKKKKILKILKKEFFNYLFSGIDLNNHNFNENMFSIKKSVTTLLENVRICFRKRFWKWIYSYFKYLEKKYMNSFLKYLYISKKNNKNYIWEKKKNIYHVKKLKKELKILKHVLLRKKKVKKKNILKKIKKKFLKIKVYKKMEKIKRNILFIKWKKKKMYISNKNNNYFIYKINTLKFIFNQKLWIFNFYFFFLSKHFKDFLKKYFFKYLSNLELNIFKINMGSVTSNIITKYVTSSFENNYSIYETLKPVLIDLKDRMRKKKVLGFKITVSGRFKRAERATYWWRKDGQLSTGTQLSAVDYSTSIHKTKYGVCSINIWLTLGRRGLNQLTQEYPTFYPFFFILKEKKKINYFLLKKNSLFLNNFCIKNKIESHNLKFTYIRGFITFLIYKYLYTNIFLRNLVVKKKKKINKNFKKAFLPQYYNYKIYLEDYLKKDFIKVVPFFQLNYLKRINLRNSYKVKFLNKTKLTNLKIFKYKIFYC